MPGAEANVAYYTVSDARYFLGAVALVNSLRLTGHGGEIVVVDTGFLPEQQHLLARECTIVDGRLDRGILPAFAKASLHRFEQDGRTAVLLDSDLIVTKSLQEIVERAQQGFICGIVNNNPHRRFPEWATMFQLTAPLRRDLFLNGSLVALSVEKWRAMLERWEQLCQAIQEERSKRPFLLRRDEAVVDPVGFPEQDVFNALLMSEVPRAAVAVWDQDLGPTWAERRGVSVVDLATLRCSFTGREPFCIECTGALKPWMPWGWSRRRYGAYMRLFTRVVLAPDVSLRLCPRQVPIWLRGSLSGRIVYEPLNRTATAAQTMLGFIPGGARARVTHRLRTFLSRGRSAETDG